MEAAKKKKHLGHRDGGWKVFLAIMAIIALIPLLYALSLSFRTQNSIFDPRLFVTDLTTGNYIKAISDNPTIVNNFIFQSCDLCSIHSCYSTLCIYGSLWIFQKECIWKSNHVQPDPSVH